MNLYSLIVLAVAIHRISGLIISAKHGKILHSRGAIEFGQEHFWAMKIFHTVWITSCFILSFYYEIIFDQTSVYFAAAFLCGMLLRIYSQFTLGVYWTENVLVIPQSLKIRTGLYRYFNHPNYVGVILEIFALPAMAKLWTLAVISSIINGTLIYFRIKSEQKALQLCQGV